MGRTTRTRWLGVAVLLTVTGALVPFLVTLGLLAVFGTWLVRRLRVSRSRA